MSIVDTTINAQRADVHLSNIIIGYLFRIRIRKYHNFLIGKKVPFSTFKAVESEYHF